MSVSNCAGCFRANEAFGLKYCKQHYRELLIVGELFDSGGWTSFTTERPKLGRIVEVVRCNSNFVTNADIMLAREVDQPGNLRSVDRNAYVSQEYMYWRPTRPRPGDNGYVAPKAREQEAEEETTRYHQACAKLIEGLPRAFARYVLDKVNYDDPKHPADAYFETLTYIKELAEEMQEVLYRNARDIADGISMPIPTMPVKPMLPAAAPAA
jgi:hypothetical protein